LVVGDGLSDVLTKDLLRVSRRGGGYQPQFADASHEALAASVIGCYQGHVDEPRDRLQDALTAIERESDDFKLVRGFSKLLDRDATPLSDVRPALNTVVTRGLGLTGEIL